MAPILYDDPLPHHLLRLFDTAFEAKGARFNTTNTSVPINEPGARDISDQFG